MGIIYGSASLTRFMVNSPLPEDYHDEFPAKISRYAFQNLDENSEAERSLGWVNILDMFDSRFDGKKYFKDPYLAISLRVDVRKVPANALKQYCREAENEIMNREDLDFLTKKRREEIKESVHLKLLKRAIPRSNTYDMIWDLQTGVVIFGSTSNKLCDEFAEVFFNTFDLNLNSIYPYSLAYQMLESEKIEPDILDGLRPSRLVEDEQ